MNHEAKRILIFRTGSLGDTTVAIPSFRLIAKAFPFAERRVLTSMPVSEHATPLSSLLEPTGLVHGYMIYPSGRLNAKYFFKLRREILDWKPDLLIYLAEPRGPLSAWRDAVFFNACGIKKLIGVPYTKSLKENKWMASANRFEHESERLTRCLDSIGKISLEDPKTWDLELTENELKRASQWLEGWEGASRFIASSVSAKVKAKAWGGENWRELFRRLSQMDSSLGMVTVGAEAARVPSEEIAEAWKGPRLNLSGKLSLRESAAVMRQAFFYLGHDSGPMHLAAAVGIPCVAIFVEYKKPGVWFPYGDKHKVITPHPNPLPLWGRGKRVRGRTPVTVEEVLKVTQAMLGDKLNVRI